MNLYKALLNGWDKKTIVIAVLGLIFSGYIQTCQAAGEQNTSIKNWKELSADPQYSINQSCSFYRLKTENGSLAALIVVDLNDRYFTLSPFYYEKTGRVSNAVKEHNALVGINGGFFNLSNGESTGSVIINSKDQCDPKQNKALIENPDLKPYLETIFNRSELRILKDSKNKQKASIAKHNDPIPAGWTLAHSLQAGPALLPTITNVEEAFTRKSVDGKLIDSIGIHKKAARTAIGITLDNHVMILCVANKNQDEFSSGATLDEISTMLQQLGCAKAINLDGGTSTTLIITEGNNRNNTSPPIIKVIAGEPEKLVKSGWLIEKASVDQQSKDSFTNFPR